MRRWILASLLLSGCLSHMPRDTEPRHLRIHWQPDFETAAKSGRPILLVMIAGDIQDPC